MAKSIKKPENEKTEKAAVNSRVRREVTRLNKIFALKSEKEREYLSSLIKRAAFMKVQLEDMETDLQTNGFTELFAQSVYTKPYERERPKARLYNALNKNYQTLMKQLSEFVDRTNGEELDDGFNSFINS